MIAVRGLLLKLGELDRGVGPHATGEAQQVLKGLKRLLAFFEGGVLGEQRNHLLAISRQQALRFDKVTRCQRALQALLAGTSHRSTSLGRFER